MEQLKEKIDMLDELFKKCDIDYQDIKNLNLNEKIYDDIKKERLINSFLFRYAKIQDSMGAKLFREILFALKEIDNYAIAMKDVLNKMEKLHIIKDASIWDKLREIRNDISHEYPLDYEERLENLKKAMWGYEKLKEIFNDIKDYLKKENLY
ncbi:hypothetical protein [Nitrosophilus kaiyonis]|uniref:hypothetical protein n=1 Tax=Nitrosophilus kaiyonis TaxID=2930200 RepID=UPI00248F6158|nr:hypothetical protein [Nitrosophilus kaiyonis]